MVLGRIGAVVATAEEFHDGSPYLRTTFAVEIDEVLKGQRPETRVTVQVLGGRTERDRDPHVGARAGGRADGAHALRCRPGRGWVPYLGSAFVLQESSVLLGDHPAEKLGIADEGEAPAALDLDELRRIVDDTLRDEAEEPAVDNGALPPPVTEQPDGVETGGLVPRSELRVDAQAADSAISQSTQ